MSSEYNSQVMEAQEVYLASLGDYSLSSPPPLLQPHPWAEPLGSASQSPSPALTHVQGPGKSLLQK